jgi:phosphoribosylanthranilate isomerase
VTLAKICGIRSVDEGSVALEAGANLLGFVFWPGSRRFIPPESVGPIVARLRERFDHWTAAGVFVDASPSDVARAADASGVDRAQLHGDDDAAAIAAMPIPVMKALSVRVGAEAEVAELVAANPLGVPCYLLDTHADGYRGGTGTAFDWAALRTVGPHCFVAGGLRPDTVGLALRTLSPLGVDVSSGVERPGGGKDPALVRAFLEAVRSHDRITNVL